MTLDRPRRLISRRLPDLERCAVRDDFGLGARGGPSVRLASLVIVQWCKSIPSRIS